MAGSGESAKNGNGFSSEEEIVESHSIVEFRPRKDWRGEYGFDWVRKGKEDYEERIRLSNSTEGVPPVIFTEMLKRYWGEAKYEEWRTQMINELKNNSIFMDERFIECAIDKKAKDEIEKNKDIYDNNAWLRDDRIARKAVAENDDVDKGVEPIEYFYSYENVAEARYYLNSGRFHELWKSEVDYDDMYNGKDEAKKAIFKLDYFLWNAGEKISMMKKGDSYIIPYYTEGNGVTIGDLPCVFCIYKQTDLLTNDYSELYDKRLSEMVDMARKGFFDNGDIGILKIGDDGLLKDLRDYPETKPLSNCRIIQYVTLMGMVTLTYRKINGILSLLANLHGCGYQLYYEDGKLKEIKNGGWKKLAALGASERKKVMELAQIYLSAELVNDTELDDLVKIMDKVQDGSIDNVVVRIGSPQGFRNFQINPAEIKKDTRRRKSWHNLDIRSWKEEYEASFRTFLHILIKDKSKEYKRYLVPVLSIPHENIKRTWFKFNSAFDAPKTIDEPQGEYELQLYYNGECDKLVFEADAPSSIKIDPPFLEKPKETNTIKVKYTGVYVPQVTVNVKGVITHWYKKDDVELAGQLMIRINHIQEVLRIFSVKVRIDDDPLPPKYVDGIKDQFDSLSNALAQIGLKFELFEIEVKILSSDLANYMDGDKIDTDLCINDVDIGDFIIGAVLRRYNSIEKDVLFLMAQSVVFIFINRGLKDMLAFQCESEQYHCSYEMFGNSISFDRGDVTTLAHETIHALSSMHSFQMKGNGHSNPFCFSIYGTSNIMDYSSHNYSLHKYQWDIMREGMMVLRSKALRHPNVRIRLRNNKLNQVINKK